MPLPPCPVPAVPVPPLNPAAPLRFVVNAGAGAVDVDAKRVPYFKPGKEMRARLNV